MDSTDGETVLSEAVTAYQTALGNRLISAYALGSLAHGGFSSLVSDIDLGLIISDPLQPDDPVKIQTVAETEKTKGPELHARLSVFWGTPSTLRGEIPGGRFPALDRLDLFEHGRLLVGIDNIRDSLPRPSLNELTVTSANFALDFLSDVKPLAASGNDTFASARFDGHEALKEILAPDLLVSRDVRRVTKLVLFPVRFLYTAKTGHVGTNDFSANHYLTDDRAPGRDLVAAALVWRTSEEFDKAAARDLLARQIVPLYLYYIDDHITRLEALGQDRLATWFRHWRERIQD
ncbi:hypothetical protein OV450_8251 [Actinobacteria bacterium OV450]|nr:hypothetical protein OV450_8251 [Actinobacteria bacterium OV450]